ncbi:MAG: hypothetical protein AAB425_08410, partial [Bdellovibrionota bacterium]
RSKSRSGLRLSATGVEVLAEKDISVLGPAFVRGALEAIGATSVSDSEKLTLVTAIAENSLIAMDGETE